MDNPGSIRQMANQSLKKKDPDNFEDYSWILFFGFSSWLIITLFFLTGIFKSILLTADKKFPINKNIETIRTVIIDQKSIQQQTQPDKEYFLSDKDNMGSGKITEKKGFEAASKSREFRVGQSPANKAEDSKTEEDTSASEKILSNQFLINLLEGKFPANDKPRKIIRKFSEASIPDSYRFDKSFAFSWDRNGQPVIPTVYYKHFEYFKKMLDKIQSNWAPPGGMPFPIYGNDFNTEGFVPGRSSYQTFPDQEVQIVFSLDASGDILEIKLWKSLRFESLDRSCIDAIQRSRNFGPPPEDLMEKNIFVMPMTFRIISNQ